MKSIIIDLNCDMGEGMATDEQIMPFISSANIACGAHAGDEETIKKTIELCLQNGVAIGAHLGFYDKENFGRTEMHLTDQQIRSLIIDQLAIINNICFQFNTKLHHVKPHGALYNMSAKDPHLAVIIAETVKEYDGTLILYGLSGSHSITAAKYVGLTAASEVFADRRYNDDGSLVHRSQPNALIDTDEEAMQQVISLITKKEVISANNRTIPIKADTICIHGDGQHAVSFAQHIHSTLVQHGIIIQQVR